MQSHEEEPQQVNSHLLCDRLSQVFLNLSQRSLNSTPQIEMLKKGIDVDTHNTEYSTQPYMRLDEMRNISCL